jgi:hypothetical protein
MGQRGQLVKHLFSRLLRSAVGIDDGPHHYHAVWLSKGIAQLENSGFIALEAVAKPNL